MSTAIYYHPCLLVRMALNATPCLFPCNKCPSIAASASALLCVGGVSWLPTFTLILTIQAKVMRRDCIVHGICKRLEMSNFAETLIVTGNFLLSASKKASKTPLKTAHIIWVVAFAENMYCPLETSVHLWLDEPRRLLMSGMSSLLPRCKEVQCRLSKFMSSLFLASCWEAGTHWKGNGSSVYRSLRGSQQAWGPLKRTIIGLSRL